ncbi:MAG TPA: glycosyltransferase [Anaerolineales bacterium]|nr:glycosyltransferase [Anaerolineales bacterium]
MIIFSVIVPTLNSPTLHLTLDALKKQNYDSSKFEIIVVGYDNKQLDGVIFDYSDHPLSPAQARNRGAELARGHILAFTDSDCIPNSNWLAVLDEQFSDLTVNVVGGGVDYRSSDYWTQVDNLCMFYEYLYTYEKGERKQLPSLNLAIRRDVFDAIGGFDEHYPLPSGEDSDLTIRLRQQGYKLFFEPRAVIVHRPIRNSFRGLLRHSYYLGMYSPKVNPKYLQPEGLPYLLRSRLALSIFAPILAAFVTARAFIKYPGFRAHFKVIPWMFLAKMVWCYGAAVRPPDAFWD